MLKNKIISATLLLTLLPLSIVFGQKPTSNVYQSPKETIDKIKDEGMNRSEVMQTISYLTDVIGPRLTNSPNLKRANEWTRDKMKQWGMQNTRLESWGPFGRGWSLKNFTAQVTSPQVFPVIGYPKAWSPSTKGVITGEVVILDIKAEADFDKYKGKLKGKIVLVSPLRKLNPIEKSLTTRFSEEDLLKLANLPEPAAGKNPSQGFSQLDKDIFFKIFNKSAAQMRFLIEEGVAVLIDNSMGGSGGTLYIQGASTAQEVVDNMTDFLYQRTQPQWKVSEALMVPQMTLATEDYNRLVRMIQFGEKPIMTVDIQTNYHDNDLMGYNTIAEIPGTDPKLKDEVVMLGGHLDSWHSSTGATDNAAGCAVAMEAARILIALGLKPRRTIRVALWSGEEQGLYGSTNYVKQHLGEIKDGNLTKGLEYDKFSAYYNLDNGTGRIRGVYLQGNSSVKPIFETWLQPFHDLGAETVTLSSTGNTDHVSFDSVGLPGFQFIQDNVEYNTRTHHSNQDNFDRIQAEDMKQASTIMAAFVYQTAMMDEKLPRKALR